MEDGNSDIDVLVSPLKLDNFAGTEDVDTVLVTAPDLMLETDTDSGMGILLGLPTVFEPCAGVDSREAPFVTELPLGTDVPLFPEE